MTLRPRHARTREESLRRWAGRLLVRGGAPLKPPVQDRTAVHDFVTAHGLGPCLDQSLQGRDPPGGVPRLEITKETTGEMAREMARDREFRRVMRKLQDDGRSDPIVLKGQALAHSVYSEPWLRPRGDIDLLVEPDNLHALTSSLITLGYQHVNAINGELILRQSCLHKRHHGIDHYWDIHWSISNRPAFAEALKYRVLRDAGVEIHNEDVTWLIPSRTHNLLIACLHLIGHHAHEVRLIWLYDIHLLAASLSEPQRGDFIQNAVSRPEIRSACHAALDLTQHYLPAEATEKLCRALDPGPRHRLNPKRRYFTRLLEDVKSTDTGSRFQLVKQHLFPSPNYMIRRFNIEQRWQLPLWYAVRIGRALPKLLRRH